MALAYAHELREVVERYLDSLSFERYPGVKGLDEAMRYPLLAEGQRVRPVLTLATARALAIDVEAALPIAASVELIHTNSLVCDDLPAMDNHSLRRGKPTLHLAYGEGIAILAGYALYTEAIRILAHQNISAEKALAMIQEVVHATCVDGMVSGQYLDLTEGGNASEKQLRQMHELKTGSLIEAAVRCPLILADASEPITDLFGRFAAELGVLYQIGDDILDAIGSEERLGKDLGSDSNLGKATYVSFYGLERAKELASQSYDVVTATLADLARQVPGSLEELSITAEYIYRRAN